MNSALKAIERGNLEELKQIIEENPQLIDTPRGTFREDYPLLYLTGDYYVTRDYPKMEESVQKNHVEMARLLLDRGANVNRHDYSGYTPLMHASKNGALLMVNLLLDYGADCKSVSGHQAVLLASRKGYDDILRLLLRAGADPIPTYVGDNAPLEVARRNGHAKCVVLLEVSYKAVAWGRGIVELA